MKNSYQLFFTLLWQGQTMLPSTLLALCFQCLSVERKVVLYSFLPACLSRSHPSFHPPNVTPVGARGNHGTIYPAILLSSKNGDLRRAQTLHRKLLTQLAWQILTSCFWQSITWFLKHTSGNISIIQVCLRVLTFKVKSWIIHNFSYSLVSMVHARCLTQLNRELNHN